LEIKMSNPVVTLDFYGGHGRADSLAKSFRENRATPPTADAETPAVAEVELQSGHPEIVAAIDTGRGRSFIEALKKQPLDGRSEPKPPSWSEVCNPKISSPMSATSLYIVHALMGEELSKQWAESLRLKGQFIPGQFIDLTREPQRIADKPVISTSLISADKPTTWGPFGFILKVPCENIVAGGPEDLGTPLASRGEVLEASLTLLHRFRGLSSPREILSKTRPPIHNEIVVRGTSSSGAKVEIAGLFLKTDSSGKPLLSAEQAVEFASLDKQLHVPVVRIPDTTKKYF
jgi:hypothetical protein